MTDIAAITHLMHTYFDGLYEGDTDKLGQAFDATSTLSFVQDEKLVHIKRDEWFAAVNNRAKPKDIGLSRHDEIVTIDILDPHTAFAKVKCALPPRYFIDILSLLKIEGQWKIVQKISAVSVKN